MSTDFLNTSFDSSLAQPVTDTAQKFPVIQWSHNGGGAGWLLPCDRAEEFDVTLPWAKRNVQLGKNTVPCFHSASAEFAILAVKKTWFTTDADGRATYLDGGYVEGARSKSHLLVIVKDQPDDLFVLSCKGATSADFHGALGKLQAAMKRANAQRPLYFFWLKASAGDPVRLSKGATVAPLLLEQPGKTDDVVAWLAQRFVGAEFVAEVEARYADDIRDFLKPHVNADAEASNGHDATTPAPLPATGPAPTSAATTTTSAAPWDAMPSATGDRAVALGLAQRWTHEAAVEWAMSLGAFDDAARARADYTFLWNRAKAENGGRIAQLAEWWPVWVDAVLATLTDQVAVEEPGF